MRRRVIAHCALAKPPWRAARTVCRQLEKNTCNAPCLLTVPDISPETRFSLLTAPSYAIRLVMESRCERLQHGVFTPGGAPSSRGAPPSSRGAPPSSARGAPPSLCGASPHDAPPPKHTPLATDIGRSFCDASTARSSRAVRDARASSSAVGVGELEAPRSACGRVACAAHDGHRARPLVLRRERGALAARRVRRARELERLRVKHNNLWRFSTPPRPQVHPILPPCTPSL